MQHNTIKRLDLIEQSPSTHPETYYDTGLHSSMSQCVEAERSDGVVDGVVCYIRALAAPPGVCSVGGFHCDSSCSRIGLLAFIKSISRHMSL